MDRRLLFGEGIRSSHLKGSFLLICYMFAYMLVALLSQVVRTPGGICQSGTEMGSTSFRFYWKLFDHIDIIASKDKRVSARHQCT